MALSDKDREVLEYLRNLKFIGPFPKGMMVLLVPVQTAFEEGKTIDSELTLAKLKQILKTGNIMVFSTIDDYVRLKQKATK